MTDKLELRRAELIQENSLRLLVLLDQIFTENNIHYWLDGGVLLQLIRDNKIAKDETDIDIGLLADNPDHIVKLLQNYGFHTWYHHEYPNGKKTLVRVEKWFVGIDLEFFEKRESSLIYSTSRALPAKILREAPGQAAVLEYHFPEGIVDKLERREFFGVTLNIPQDYDEYLQVYYGNWHIHIDKKEYVTRNLTEFEIDKCILPNTKYNPEQFLRLIEQDKSSINLTPMTGSTIAVGVLVYHPNDDKYHFERIQNCLTSICNAIEHCFSDVVLLIGKNISENIVTGSRGMVAQTEQFLKVLANKKKYIRLMTLDYKGSMNIKGYSILHKTLFYETGANYIAVFADDYIMPKNWFNTILLEFQDYPDADFIMPSTTYVTHRNLLVPLKEKSTWVKNINELTGELNGIHCGVTFEDVEELASEYKKSRTIHYVPSPSYETTVFTRRHLQKYGFIYDKYYSLFYNIEYFSNSIENGAKGYITRKGFVFHYGKGGTSAVHKKTGDEKYLESPAEKFLIADVDLYNKRNKANHPYWWQEKKIFPRQKHNYSDIMAFMHKFDYEDIINNLDIIHIIKRNIWLKGKYITKKIGLYSLLKPVAKMIRKYIHR